MMRNQIVYLDPQKTYRIYSDSSLVPYAIHYRGEGEKWTNVRFHYPKGKIIFKGGVK